MSCSLALRPLPFFGKGSSTLPKEEKGLGARLGDFLGPNFFNLDLHYKTCLFGCLGSLLQTGSLCKLHPLVLVEPTSLLNMLYHAPREDSHFCGDVYIEPDLQPVEGHWLFC